MSQASAIQCNKGEWGIRWIHHAKLTMMTVLLVISGLPVVAEEMASATDDKIHCVVADAELEAIYGKGYQSQAFRPEVAVPVILLPVILWDEGKRKVPFHGTRTELASPRMH